MTTLHSMNELPEHKITAEDVGGIWFRRVYRHVAVRGFTLSAAQLLVDLSRSCKHSRATIMAIASSGSFRAAKYLCM